MLLWLPWPRGAHTAAAEATLGISVAFLLMGWAAQYLRNRVARPSLSKSALIALCIWTLWLLSIALQLAPLPEQWLATLAPTATKTRQALNELPGSFASSTLSIVPGETVRQLLLSLSYFGLYLLALLVTASRKRQRIVLLTLVSVGLVQALYGIQRMYSGFDLGGLLDIPANTSGRASGSFINPNHFAAYLELVLAAGLGLILADLRGWTGGSWRHHIAEVIDLTFSTKFRVRVFMVAVVVALVLSQSRMGNAAFFTALCLCGGTYLLLRQKRWLAPALVLFISVVLIDIWIVSDRFGLERVVTRIQKTEISKEARPLVLADLQPAFEAYAVTGAGAGAFEAAYSPYRNEEIGKRYDHAHNEYAEFLIENGLHGIGLLALLVGLHLLKAVKIIYKRRDPVRSGVAFAGLMALTAMLIHASAEFMLRIPAVAATLVTLMAMLINISDHRRTRTENQITNSQATG
ncbi:MAG: O-antigen ligase family protein [Pseudomonadota bacterium]